MSRVTIQGNPSGTGIFTIASPNSNTNQTITLPDASGTLLTNSGTEPGAFSTLSVAGNNISAVNSVGFRNRIINGDMVIDQRNNGSSVTVNNNFVWSVDRWGGEDGSDGAFTLQQSTTVPSTGGFVNSLQATVTTADTAPAAGQYAVLTQFIEGFNIADFGWGTSGAVPVTISCWVRASVAGTYSCTLYNNGASRINPQPLVINSANTWEYKTITFAGDTSGTWLTNNGRGVVFNIYLLLGTTGAAGWNSGTHFGVNGQANLLATVSNTFNITGVQLEAGSVATPFERLPYSTELALCQRYFWRPLPFPGIGAGQSAAQVARMRAPTPVTMRTSPTLTLVGQPSLYNGGNVGSMTGLLTNYSSPGSVEFDATASTSMTLYACVVVYNNYDSATVAASAEL